LKGVRHDWYCEIIFTRGGGDIKANIYVEKKDMGLYRR
jgi:hypothetical protein